MRKRPTLVIAFWPKQADLFPMQLVFMQIFNDYRS